MSEAQLKVILEFLALHLPIIITALGAGHYLGNMKAKKLKSKILDLEVELEKKSNEDSIEKKYEGISDMDVVNSIVSKSRPK